MSAEKLKNFQLHFEIIYHTEQISFSLGKFFSLEGELIINNVDEINFLGSAMAVKTLCS